MGLLTTGVLQAQVRTLIDCPGPGSSGDRTDRGFYIPDYPGTTLNSITVYMQTFTGSAGTWQYQVGVHVTEGAYNGARLDEFRWANATLNTTQKAVTIQFGNVPVTPGSTVCFRFSINKQPGSPDVLYAVPDFVSGCPEVIQTSGTGAPLSSFRRNGVKIQVMGEPYLNVDGGGPIQLAIDNAEPGDIVAVAPGSYNEDLNLRSGIDVQGSGADDTILTGTGAGTVVTATSIDNMEFSGFTVQGGGTGGLDAGFTIINSNIVVRNNTITGNAIGIRTFNSASFICSNLITGNGNEGNPAVDHAVRCGGSDLFAGNRIVENEGGPIASGSTGSQFVNNTIADNGWWGFQAANATTTLKNNILSGNTGGGVFSENDSVIQSTYNCIFGNGGAAYSEIRGGTVTSRLGDILVAPGFDSSQPGAYVLSESSPCIDAGDPAAIYNDIDGSRNDIGASGGLCGSASPPGSIVSGFVWTSIGTYANIEDIEQSGAKRGLTKVRDRPFGGSPWLYGAFGFSETGIFRYAVKIAKWTGGTPPLPGDFEYVDDPLSKVRFDISGGTLSTSRVALGPFEFAGRPTYVLTRNSGNIFWSHENLRMVLNTLSLDNGTYSVRMEALDIGGSAISFTVNQDIIMTVNNTRPVASIDSVSYNGGPPFTECSFIRLPSETSTLDFEYTAYHADGFLDNYELVVEFGRNRSGGNIVTDSYSNHVASNGYWEGETTTMVAATPVSPEQALPNLQLWETCAYQFRIRAWARTTNGFARLYRKTFFDTYVIDLQPPVVCSPDLDGDGDVDAQDLAILAAAYGTAP